jgi:hypothetical protein
LHVFAFFFEIFWSESGFNSMVYGRKGDLTDVYARSY